LSECTVSQSFIISNERVFFSHPSDHNAIFPTMGSHSDVFVTIPNYFIQGKPETLGDTDTEHIFF
jgi:hypothetical protein